MHTVLAPFPADDGRGHHAVHVQQQLGRPCSTETSLGRLKNECVHYVAVVALTVPPVVFEIRSPSPRAEICRRCVHSLLIAQLRILRISPVSSLSVFIPSVVSTLRSHAEYGFGCG